jgi:hypothetical protein
MRITKTILVVAAGVAVAGAAAAGLYKLLVNFGVTTPVAATVAFAFLGVAAVAAMLVVAWFETRRN